MQAVKKSKKSKYDFTLQGINTAKLKKTYGLSVEKNNTTQLSELDNAEKNTPDIVSFLDESKKKHQCYISMVDYKTKLPIDMLAYNCYWCRHPFDTKPLGCPIKHIPERLDKSYYSYINKDTYNIKESVNPKKFENNHYESDGIFCSFNCCKSWIEDNKKNILYKDSSILLNIIYNKFMDTKKLTITPAPHWRLLQEYGGHLDIIKFREGFNKTKYEFEGIEENLPTFLPVRHLYEEYINF